MWQSSLYVTFVLDLSVAHSSAAGDFEPLRTREDFAYCFGRIISAVRDHHRDRAIDERFAAADNSAKQ